MLNISMNQGAAGCNHLDNTHHNLVISGYSISSDLEGTGQSASYRIQCDTPSNTEERNNHGQSHPCIHGFRSTNPLTNADTSSVASRCSVRVIHETISNFSPEKKDLVRSIGFHGLLHFPALKQINLRFSAWLMARVDELSQSINIPGARTIHFTKEDVAMVFGIPASGRSIVPKTARLFSVCTPPQPPDGHINVKQLRSIKAAHAIVLREQQGPMSSIDQDEFKAAFVVFVMSTLLAPCSKHDRVSDDYLHIIADPAKINSYDWADYVVRRLLESVAKLKADLASNVKMPYIYGCSLFLQVLYLDSIDLGALSMDHNIFPRVRCFTYDRLRSMIAAESTFASSATTAGCAGVPSKLRTPDGICYHWATSTPTNGDPCTQSETLALWDASILLTRVFKTPLEAAGPLFLAASEYQRQSSSAEFRAQISNCPGAEALKFMSLLLSIMEPYANGFSYQSSITADTPHTAPCTMRQPQVHRNRDASQPSGPVDYTAKSLLRQAGTSLDTPPVATPELCLEVRNKQNEAAKNLQITNRSTTGGHLEQGRSTSIWCKHIGHDTDTLAMKAMARFYMILRTHKELRCTNLNDSPPSVESPAPLHAANDTRQEQRTRCQFEMGCSCHIDLSKTQGAYKKISMVEDTDEPWIIHFSPKYIEVLTCSVKTQLLGKSEMETELFDVLIRRFKQDDDEKYSHKHPTRWRHYVESDFMVSLLVAPLDMSDPAVRACFQGRHISYDVTTCEILFFPAILQHRWVCFAWRLKDNTIVVYDPCMSATSRRLPLNYYERVGNALKSAMATVSDNIFQGWRKAWEEASIEVFPRDDSLIACPNRSGVMCLYFCRCYDGLHVRSMSPPATVEDIVATLVMDLSSLAGNLGSIPALFR